MTARPPLVALLAALAAALTLLLVPAALATSVAPADPLALLAVQQARLLGGTLQDAAAFGHSVALSGDTALVGAPYEMVDGQDSQGAAYVYTCSGGVWTQQGGPLVAADGDASDWFGFSVALDGDTALVGAYGADAAYVFVRRGGVWTQQGGPLTGAPDSFFGVSVALDGDTALVGAPIADSVYVFTRNAGAWTQQGGPLTGAPDSYFGWSVALDGDTALVGAPSVDSVYVFTRTAGVWAQQGAALTGPSSSWFGWSVAVDGDTALIGAYGAGGYDGAAYVFVRRGGTWTQQGGPLAGPSDSFFGISVALNGDTALVGAAFADSAYVFTRNGGAWTEQGDPLTGQSGSFFGWSVALEGDTALVGADVYALAPSSARANGGSIRPGAAYVFSRRPVTFTLNAVSRGQSALVRYSPSAGGELVPEELWRGALDASHARLAAGDLDGDGFADAAVLTQDGRHLTLLAWLSSGSAGAARRSGPAGFTQFWQGEAPFTAEVQIACGDGDGRRGSDGPARGEIDGHPRDELWLYAERGSAWAVWCFSGLPGAAPQRTLRRPENARAAGLWSLSSAAPQLACADADGDGLLEPLVLSVPRSGRGQIELLRDAGDRIVRELWWRGELPAGARFAAGDVGGDGLGDAIVSAPGAPGARYPFVLWLLPSTGSSFSGPRYWRPYRARSATLLALAAGDARGDGLADPALVLAQGRSQAELALSMTDPLLSFGTLPISYGYGLISGLPVRIAVAPARATAR